MTTSRSPQALEWRPRLRASLIHLGGSAVFAAIVAALIFALWFPGAYRKLSGGDELFRLIVGVDLALGPLITLAVFDRRKPWRELKRDLFVVAILQLAAFGFGLHILSNSRPVVLALEKNRFRVVAAGSVYAPELPTAPPEFRQLPFTGPRLVDCIVPVASSLSFDAVRLAVEGFDVGTRPSLWRHWDDAARHKALASARPLSVLATLNNGNLAKLDATVAELGLARESLVFVPMITFRGDWVALLDTSQGDVVGFAPVNGFE